MSTDRRDNDSEGDEKHRELLEESRESVGEERRESVHSDGGSPIPRNQDVQDSGNSAENTSEVLIPSEGEKKEKPHREGSERDHQDSEYSSKESSLLRKQSHSERSPQRSPEKTRKTSQESNEDREKLRERSEEHRYSGKQSSQSSSGSQKRSHSEKSRQHSPERMRKTSTDSGVKDDERRLEKQRERSEERRYSNKESSHSSSGSRKRSHDHPEKSSQHSPEKRRKTSETTDSEMKSSDTRRFKIPKKEHKADDLREKLDKKPERREADRREPERSASETSKSTKRKEIPITSSALKKEIKDLLRTEHHHLMKGGKKDSNGDIQGVEWCYQYLDPSIRGHITGGRAILHHRCRQCNRICLHLLGKYGTGQRMCLTCAARESGWKEKEVPSWYYHDDQECSNCKNTKNDRPSSGSYYNSRPYYNSRY